jgi:hypothetical protein
VVVGSAAAAVFLWVAAPAWATAPVNIGLPWATGVFADGQELTVSNGDWTGTLPLAMSYQWQRCDSVKSAVLADSPVAYWRFGETFGASSAADANGSGNAGTYTNAPTLGATGGLVGDPDTAVRFDGVGSFVDVPDAASLKPGSAFSLEAWVKTTASSGKIVVKPLAAGSTVSYELSVSSGKAQVRAQLTGGVYSAVSTSSVNDGQWHHLVGTFASSSLKIYVDGSSQATTSTTGNLQYSTLKVQIGPFDAGDGAPRRRHGAGGERLQQRQRVDLVVLFARLERCRQAGAGDGDGDERGWERVGELVRDDGARGCPGEHLASACGGRSGGAGADLDG